MAMAAVAFVSLSAALFLAADSGELPCALPACKTVGGGSEYFDVQFCLAALAGGSDDDGRSAAAASHCMDYRAYSAVAADLLAANLTATAAKIDALLRDSAAPAPAPAGAGDDGGAAADETTARRCLRSCRALYGGAARRQPGCAAAVRDGGRNWKGEATACLEEAAAAAEECEDGFRRSKAASPVTGENQNAFRLAKLAVALLRFA